MKPDEFKILIAAVTSSLYDLRESLESMDGIVPASQIYLALGMDIGKYELVADALKSGGLAEVTSETIRLTKKGLDLGKVCSEILEEAKKEKVTS